MTNSNGITATNTETVILTGTALAIVRAAVREFLALRDRPLQPEAAGVLGQLLRTSRPSRHTHAIEPLPPAALTAVDTRQAARILGISQAGVRARIHRGTLPAERTCDGWQIRPLDLGVIAA